ncbi:MAG TPA: hypothetical protein VL282_01290 [Tepidisphaeraceae bacterium]|jgi:hypothetical protein|nr:hypothetical protein [Tepidisphaeraceae bacterium]
MRARDTLDYTTEAKPGLVVTEVHDGFAAYRKRRPLSYWLLMGFVTGALWFLFIAGAIVAVVASDWSAGAPPGQVIDALLHASRHEIAQRFLAPVGKMTVIIPFTVGLACLGFFSAADWRLSVHANKLQITNSKGRPRLNGPAEDMERMRVNWCTLEIRFRKSFPCNVTLAKRRDALLLRSMIAKHLGLVVDEKSGRCQLATALKPPAE